MAPIVVSDLRGGRNGQDNPVDPLFPANQSVEAYNVDYADATLVGRRGGATSLSVAGGTAFTGAIETLIRHLSAGEDTAEFWGIDTAFVVKRLVGSSVWADVTLDDAIASLPHDVVGVSFNGKLVLFYDSAQNRVHIFDPNLAAPRVRRWGVAAVSTAPTVANNGAGAYAATPRYYRIRYLQLNGTVVVRRSEPSSNSTQFTPSGGGASARVTRGTAPGEGETHWEVEGSQDGSNFYRLAQIDISVSTYDDSATVGSYSNNTLSDSIGYYTTMPSAKFGVTDGNRLIAGGAHEDGQPGSRVWFTPVLGSGDQGDDERLFQTNTRKPFLDLNERDGGDLTGLGGPVDGVIVGFKYRQVYRMTATGDDVKPYNARRISSVIGSINHKGIVLAEDELGRPALYWMSHRGPYRYGYGGIQYMGRDVEDQWYGKNDKEAVNLDATIVCHGKYVSDKGEIWWHVATGSSNTPNLRMKLRIKDAIIKDQYGVRGGWSFDTGDSVEANCCEVFAESIGATMGRRLKPYVGLSGSAAALKCDVPTAGDDNGTPFRAYVRTKSLIPTESLGGRYGIQDGVLFAKAQDDTTIRITAIRDFGAGQSDPVDVSIEAEGAESAVVRKVDALWQANAGVLQIEIGDPADISVLPWQIYSLSVNPNNEGSL